MDGIVNIWKPAGLTSHDVVARVRRAAGTRRVGHTGTLDPMAEGVLPICIGKATHAVDFIVAAKKTYECTLCLGKTTDTEDSTGTVLAEAPVLCSADDVKKALASFVGECDQIPPMYSAVHHGGQRLYALARQGITVERKPRRVTFYAIKPTTVSLPEVTFTVECSKGAYIRTLCKDIGEVLGCGAHMTALARTECGRFTKENAVLLSAFEEAPEIHVLPTETVFAHLPQVTVCGEAEKRIRNGAAILNPYQKDGQYAVFSEDGTFLCLSEGVTKGNAYLLKMITSFY
ncbi:MAG: tRNA pseudouridine(55) synthase TruB [Ruminococcaceae bacterium]|nr:tRNA pseudouridine(55) synthase TruB [Oscillospiraceae bacterium]